MIYFFILLTKKLTISHVKNDGADGCAVIKIVCTAQCARVQFGSGITDELTRNAYVYVQNVKLD